MRAWRVGATSAIATAPALARTSSLLLAVVVAAIVAPACDGDSDRAKVLTVGTPSPDLPTVASPSALALGPCPSGPDPAGVGTWRPISSVGAPPWAERALWTGVEMVVVNSTPGLEAPSLMAYDPALDRWRSIPVSGGEPFDRSFPFMGVVGGDLFVFGGGGGGGDGGTDSSATLTDGWLIDLRTGAARPISSFEAPALDSSSNAQPGQRVFAQGTRALVVPAGVATDVATVIYDVASSTWTTVAPPSTTKTFGCAAVGWNGTAAICSAAGYVFRMTVDPPAVVPFPRLLDDGSLSLQLTPVGDRFLAWGGGANATAGRIFWVDPTMQTWGPATTTPRRAGALVATVNGQVVIWGGSTGTAAATSNSGVVLDPIAGTWSHTSCAGAPSAPGASGGAVVATNFGIIVFNGSGLSNGVLSLW